MYKGNSGKQKKTKMQVLRMYKSSTEYLPSTQVLENYFGFLGERKKGKKKKWIPLSYRPYSITSSINLTYSKQTKGFFIHGWEQHVDTLSLC